jgi:hypothetical protein
MVSRHQAAINSGAAPTRRGAEPLLQASENNRRILWACPFLHRSRLPGFKGS